VFTLALLRVRFVLVERAIPTDKSGFSKSRLTAPLKRFATRKALTVVVNGYAQVNHYTWLFAIKTCRIRVIPNSRPIRNLHIRVTELRRNRAALRTTLGLRENSAIISCVGRLSAPKGQSTLLQAISAMLPCTSEVQVVLVGEGEAMPGLQQQAANLPVGTVHFAGYNKDIVPFLAASDYFVLPTFNESLSGALIEAMAAGLPCVTTDIPGNRELVQHGLTGLLVPPQNPEALAAALRTLLENPTEARRLAEAGYQHVLQHYDEANETLLWRKLLDEIAEIPEAK
jgi:glycosyltransferase involved in cell wall biosynthesis